MAFAFHARLRTRRTLTSIVAFIAAANSCVVARGQQADHAPAIALALRGCSGVSIRRAGFPHGELPDAHQSPLASAANCRAQRPRPSITKRGWIVRLPRSSTSTSRRESRQRFSNRSTAKWSWLNPT